MLGSSWSENGQTSENKNTMIDDPCVVLSWNCETNLGWPHKACKIVGTWKGIPWMSKGDFASEMKELQQHQWLGRHLNHWLTWCSWKKWLCLYWKYVAMSICHDVGCTCFYCFQNDQRYPERTTKGVKNCEENLQWNVELESRLWWILTPNLLGVLWGTQRHVAYSPENWRLETKNRALENDFPFHLGDDQLPAVGFRELVAQKIPKGTFSLKFLW